MTQARGFDEQPIWPGLAQQTPKTDLKRRAVDAAQAATGHFAQCETIARLGQQRGIQADLAELIDQHRPALIGRALSQQMPDQAGLAGA
ncbi:hypothetical protein D3C80_1857560 [compost metagenome]